MRPTLRAAAVLLALLTPWAMFAPGCGARSSLEDGESDSVGEDGGPDARHDAGDASDALDAPEDTPSDVGSDGFPDGATDAPSDAPADVPADVPEDVPVDAVHDAPTDAVHDAPADAVHDAPADVTPDGPCHDNDGDGYTNCDGDCDDDNPLINPGAFDFPNGIDDDCNNVIDDGDDDCGQNLAYTSQDPVEYAKAIDICRMTTAGAQGPAKTWGLLSAAFHLADGSGTPSPQSHAIVTNFGTVLVPRKNENFVVLSTGLAATPSQPYWQAGTPQTGTDLGTQSATPVGFPVNKEGCPLPMPAVAFNPVNLELVMRVPTNATAMGFDHAFFSAEFPEYACSQFNDLWVALVDTDAPGLPNNRNVIFDSQGTPGSVNLNFFDRCVAGPTGCNGTPGFNFCSGGKAELAGTGYAANDNACGAPSSIGGSTGWITTETPVVPGEIITVQFMIWDSSDPIYDSAALLDHVHWLEESLANPRTFR